MSRKINWLFAASILLSLLAALCNVLMPMLLESMVDSLTAQLYQLIYNKLLLYTGIIIALLLIELLRKLSMARYSCLVTDSIRDTLTGKLLSLPPAKFFTRSNAEFLSVYNNDISVVVNEYNLLGIDIVFNLFMLFACCVALFIINPIVAAVTIATNILTLATPFLFKRKLGQQKNEVLLSLRKYNVKLGDSIAGFSLIRFHQIKSTIQGLLSLSSKKHLRKDLQHNYTISVLDVTVGAFSFLSLCIMLFVGIYFIMHDRLSVGGLFAAMQLSDLVSAPFINISSALGTFFAAKAARKDLFAFFDDVDATAEKAELPCAIKKIELRNVSFSYVDQSGNSEGSCIFSNANLVFECNKKYLVVGGNGSGKSTLLKLLAGVYRDYQGKICINECDIRQLSDAALFERMGYVQQAPFIFNDTIQNNTTLYRDYPQEKVDSAWGLVRLGLENTEREYVDSAVSLSGGEQQKIALARVLLENKPVLLLDEAMSSMDEPSSTEIERMLLKNPMLTVINVAHKLNRSLLSEYDAIIHVYNGNAQIVTGKEEMENFFAN